MKSPFSLLRHDNPYFRRYNDVNVYTERLLWCHELRAILTIASCWRGPASFALEHFNGLIWMRANMTVYTPRNFLYNLLIKKSKYVIILNKTKPFFSNFRPCDLYEFIKKMTKLQFHYVTSIFALVVSILCGLPIVTSKLWGDYHPWPTVTSEFPHHYTFHRFRWMLHPYGDNVFIMGMTCIML